MSDSRLEHHDYPRLDVECCCRICKEWRERRVEYESLRRFVNHHSRSCFCWKCCRTRELQIEYLAVQNKRDVYCELSWHASKHNNGSVMMKWLEKELMESDLSDGWWAKTSPVFSLGHWVWLFKEHVRTSGIVVTGSFA